MTKYLLWQRQIQCHQHDWPVNRMETDNILTDQMQVSRPVLLVEFIAVAVHIIAKACNVVAEGIDPYINNMFVIKINRNTPFERGSGYTQILKTRQKEVVHHLVLTGFRLNKFRMCINIINQSVCIFAQFEEIRFFLGINDFAAAVRTLAVHQLTLCKERFTRCTVFAFIVALINISLIMQLLENLLNLLLMVFICCTDKLVIGCIHQIPDLLDLTGYIVYKLLRGNTCFACFDLNLLTMLICTCLETDIVSLHSLKTCNTVSQNDFISITDMWLA